MVQAAAQAQAVVAAAKNRGGGLVPMNAAQITALSQIQAQAIVNARPQTALVASGEKSATPTAQQLQNQIQLQAQALVHAHTQAQISAGIFRGDATGNGSLASSTIAPKRKIEVSVKQSSKMRPSPEPLALSIPPKSGITLPGMHKNPIIPTNTIPAKNIPSPIKKQHASTCNHPVTLPKVAQYPVIPKPPSNEINQLIAAPSIAQTVHDAEGEGGQMLDPKSIEFLSNLDDALATFWTGQLKEMHNLVTYKPQSEQDFKNHNDLPLARIKRIMKSDEDVRMIAAEAPVLFAKACEMFILEMSLRSYHYSENNQKKTLTREDVKDAISFTNIFDFLVDVIH